MTGVTSFTVGSDANIVISYAEPELNRTSVRVYTLYPNNHMYLVRSYVILLGNGDWIGV